MKKIKNWYSELSRSQVKAFWAMIGCMAVELALFIWNVVSVNLLMPWLWALPLVCLVIIVVMFIRMLRRWARDKMLTELSQAFQNMFKREEGN
jgi:cytochrome c-type biogenesis protein CcmH/NrfF